MEFEVNDKVYEVKLNIRFVRALDRLYKIEESGLSMGMGVTFGYSALDTYSIGELSKILPLAIGEKLTVGQVDELIEQYAEENDGLSGLFEGLKDALKVSPVTKDTVGNYLNSLQENQ